MITAFITCLAIFLAIILGWSFKSLTTDSYQMLACVPKTKNGDGYKAVNYTYYGFILAGASVFSSTIYLVLTAFAGIPLTLTFISLIPVLLITIPAAGWMAKIIEHKRHSFTVGGAGFVAYIIAPLIVWAVSSFYGMPLSSVLIPILAAMQIAFIFGEGLGRLGCISFGCCYGKPISQVSPFWNRIFSKWNFVYSSPTKKACYASKLQNQKLVPIQGITSIIYCLAGLLGTVLFFSGYYGWALLSAAMAHQSWRIISELLRADFRGSYFRVSKYQLMAFINITYAILLTAIFPAPQIDPITLSAVFAKLWTAETILILQTQWLGIFYFMGRSRVTGSNISFHVNEEAS